MKCLLLVCLSFVLTNLALAQDSPKSELFGGYSYMRTDEESIDLSQFGATGTATRRSANLNGFNIAITGNFNSRFGIVADIGGYYGTIDYAFNSTLGSSSIGVGSSFYTFLFGPQFSVRKDKVTFFTRAMAGFARGDQSITVGGQRISDVQNVFAFGAGGGLDVHLSERISVRAIQGDYILTKFDQGTGNNTQHNLRLSTGLVFRNKD